MAGAAAAGGWVRGAGAPRRRAIFRADQQPRGAGRRSDHRDPERRTQLSRGGRRGRRAHGPGDRRAADDGRSAAGAARRFGKRARRRSGAGGRQSVRPGCYAHARHRQRGRPFRRPGWQHQRLHPDRRHHEPRQLRRRVGGHFRPGGRHQHVDPGAEGPVGGGRIRPADQQRQTGDRPVDRGRKRPLRLAGGGARRSGHRRPSGTRTLGRRPLRSVRWGAGSASGLAARGRGVGRGRAGGRRQRRPDQRHRRT